MRCTLNFPRFSSALFVIAALAAIPGRAFATTPVVTVTSPTSGSQDSSPVNFTAPDCSSGIAAMRIYTAPGVGAYTTDSNSFDVNLNLAAGSYNTVVQAWDNCGGVGKTPVNITVTGMSLPSPRFLYSSDSIGNLIYGFNVDPSTGVISPTSQVSVPTGSSPNRIASDKGGFRLYVTNTDSKDVAGYFINRNDGSLSPVPGSPGAVSGDPVDIAVHPSGDYIYVPVFVTPDVNYVYAFAIQANGSLVPVAGSPFATNFPSPFNTEQATAVAIDPTGSFLYVTAYASSYVDAYVINKSNGALTPVAGEPFFLNGDIHQGGAQSLAFAQGGQHLVVPGWFDRYVTVFDVNASTGALTNAPGSPIPLQGSADTADITAIAVDPTDRWWYLYELFDNYGGLATLTAQDTAEQAAPGQCGSVVVADPSGKFVYATGTTDASCTGNPPGAILGFSVNQSNGTLTPLPGSPFPSQNSDYLLGAGGLVVTP
jgi:6-phosphogluconolactonase (cycloisomerase 2 family)